MKADPTVAVEAYLISVAAPSLTYRRRQIIALVVRGYKNSEIADELGIEVGTVKNILNRIFRVLGVKDRFDLMLKYHHSRVTTLLKQVEQAHDDGFALKIA